jgi:hypothetical protein
VALLYFFKENFLARKTKCPMEGNKKCYFQLKENRFNLARRKAGMSYRREQEMLLLPQIDYAT